MRQATEMLPNHVGYRVNLALISDYASDFEAAEREVRTVERPNFLAVLVLAYSQIGRGLVREATETYQKLATMGARGAEYADTGFGDLLVYQGRFADAIRHYERSVEADLKAEKTDRAAATLTTIGYVHFLAGQRGRAAAAAERALQLSKAMPVQFLAARVLVETDKLDEARKLAAAVSAFSDASGEAKAHGKILEAEIAIKSGNPQQAVTILTEANAILDTWLGHFALGRAHMAAGRFVQADSEFDQCIGRRGEALSLMNEGATFGQVVPLAYYYRGRVREELKTASFADSYREYLTIRGASTEDPLVPEVRKRVGN